MSLVLVRALWLSLALFALALPARADVAACVAAAEAGQVQRDERKLGEARASFVTCADAKCPRAVRKECNHWLSEVNERLPSIVISVRDENGRDVSGANVWLDGRALEPGELGKELPLDPGPHQLRAEKDGTESELELVASEREQGRIVTLALHAPLPPPVVEEPVVTAEPPPTKRRVLGPVLVMSAGALALGGAGLLTLAAKGDADDLRKKCAPNCARSDVDSVSTKAHVADALLGVGAAAIVAGIVWWAWPVKQARQTDVAVTPRGVLLRGRF